MLWRFEGAKALLRVVAVRCQFTAFATGDDQVIPPVAVQIEPGDAGARLTEAMGQEGLTREIVERFLVMGVLNQMTDILEYWWGIGGS